VLSNFIRITVDMPIGETWLAASALLGIMALPTIISVSEEAISSVPR
jgi:phosphate transport system permease protein